MNGNPTGASALAGLRVLDFTWAWAGPISTMLLANMGAEIIKVESHGRLDSARTHSPYPDGEDRGIDSGGTFNTYNRNKKSCTLNLREPKALEIARLVALSDVVVENFSPPVMGKLGLDYESCQALKPDIIYLSLSGYGASGPSRDYVSYGMQLQAFSGLTSLTGYVDGPPRNVGTPVCDTIGGVAGAFGILAALHHRRATGEGQNIDISECEALASFLPEAILDYFMNGRVQSPTGNHDEIMAPHNAYRCRGADNWVSIAVGTDEEWSGLCKVIGRPDLMTDPRFTDCFARHENQDEMDGILAAWASNHTDYEAMHILQSGGVAAGAVLSNAQLVQDPHLNERGFCVEDDHPVAGKRKLAGSSWHLDRTPARIESHAPLLGQHNKEIMRGLLGMSQEEFDALLQQKVIY